MLPLKREVCQGDLCGGHAGSFTSTTAVVSLLLHPRRQSFDRAYGAEVSESV